MRIAFDVKGTLDGPKGHIILSALHHLLKQGHTCVVWSNLYSYAADFVRDNELDKLGVEAMSKKSLSDLEGYDTQPFDYAIEDDTRQTYLAAKQFIFVHQIETTGDLINVLLK